MEDDKLKNWLEFTKHYAAESFWKEVFNQSNSENTDKTLKPSTNERQMNQTYFPRCDMYEQDEYLFIEAEFPGLTEENFSIMLQGQDLTITGNYSTLKPSLRYYLKEREDRRFEKKIILPVKVNKAGIFSCLENGLLTIAFPIIKEEEAVPIYIDLSTTNFTKQMNQYEQ